MFNKNYTTWVKENIKPIDFEVVDRAVEWKWDAIEEASKQGHPEVVLVTQTTASRCAHWPLRMHCGWLRFRSEAFQVFAVAFKQAQ